RPATPVLVSSLEDVATHLRGQASSTSPGRVGLQHFHLDLPPGEEVSFQFAMVAGDKTDPRPTTAGELAQQDFSKLLAEHITKAEEWHRDIPKVTFHQMQAGFADPA